MPAAIGDRKVCSKCNEEKSFSEFNKKPGSKDRLLSRCKKCINASVAQWARTVRGQKMTLERGRKWRRLNRKHANEIVKRHRFKIKYGLSLEERQRQYEQRQGKCDSCQKLCAILSVDEDHEAAKRLGHVVIRGYLCNNCNPAAGMLKDDPALCRELADYLDRAKVAKSLETTLWPFTPLDNLESG